MCMRMARNCGQKKRVACATLLLRLNRLTLRPRIQRISKRCIATWLLAEEPVGPDLFHALRPGVTQRRLSPRWGNVEWYTRKYSIPTALDHALRCDRESLRLPGSFRFSHCCDSFCFLKKYHNSKRQNYPLSANDYAHEISKRA